MSLNHYNTLQVIKTLVDSALSIQLSVPSASTVVTMDAPKVKTAKAIRAPRKPRSDRGVPRKNKTQPQAVAEVA